MLNIMNRQSAHKDLMQLSPAERILLAQDLWDSVAEDAMPFEPSHELRALLEERIEAYRKNPKAGCTWDEVKARLQDCDP